MSRSARSAAVPPAEVVRRWTPPGFATELVVVDLDRPRWPLARSLACLDVRERSVVARFRDRRTADRYIVRHAVLRHHLSGLVDLDPGAIVLRLGPQGKPGLAPPHDGVAFNMSSSGAWCVVASGGAAAVGVDIERVQPQHWSIEALRYVLSPAELAEVTGGTGTVTGADGALRLCRAWTRKEAMAKAVGVGLGAAVPALGVDVTVTWRRARWPTGAAYPSLTDCRWTDLSPAVPGGNCLALMVVGPEAPG